MGKSILNESDLGEIMARLERLTPEAVPRWGKMSAHETIVHLADPMRVALGIRPVAFRKSFLSMWPMKSLVLNYLPFPKNAPTAREFVQGDKGTMPVDFAADMKELLKNIEQFQTLNGKEDLPLNPVFGKLTADEWASLQWKHIDHHLKQFGL